MKYLYDVNVHGAFYTAREAAKHMVPRGSGSIILISSMSANVRYITELKYCMTDLYQIVNLPQVGNKSIIYATVIAGGNAQ
jgi:NADP-dependent 3-hydroxy acid dehydrogenase YdfG